MDLKHLVRDERADLAAFLETLTPQQWDAPTLCRRWRVRDVVAHVVSYEELNVLGVLGRFGKGRFSPSRVNAVGVAEYTARTPAELIELLRDHLEPRGMTAALGGAVGLTDALIHHQDIRRPLGLPREIPPERLAPVLRSTLTAPVLGGFWRVRGLRLVATDLDWTAGSGLEVRGPAEPLMMAIAGRRGVVGELSGPGQGKLAARLGG
ncbi:maleylpyruvate isomerase family mycothiol-dependent enzyme [Amycolatopsis sp. NPDC049868]|uniref:maleylpyruvate isomerase family mycothiol-dependent enzyme n=1 Tax=Amycolatopsis sp. NPDC049868 TaxID=3363934 RepID=UPI003798A77C